MSAFSGNSACPELTLDNAWSIGEPTFGFLIEDLKLLEAVHLVEFGSGISTVRIALQLPHIELLSIESNPDFYRATLDRVQKYASSRKLTLDLRELCWQQYGLGLYQSYRPGFFFSQIDAVLIDGPPGSTRRGREACLYQVFRMLRIGGRVYLDDFDRPAEQQIVQNWMSAYPSAFQARILDFSPQHHLCVLEKVRNVRFRTTFEVAWDNWTDNFRRKTEFLMRYR